MNNEIENKIEFDLQDNTWDALLRKQIDKQMLQQFYSTLPAKPLHQQEGAPVENETEKL